MKEYNNFAKEYNNFAKEYNNFAKERTWGVLPARQYACWKRHLGNGNTGSSFRGLPFQRFRWSRSLKVKECELYL